MATSVLMTSHDHNSNIKISEDHLESTARKTTETRNDHFQTARQRNATPRRKSTKKASEGKKKPRQRGMGVAQLESLRLGAYGERWKKMTGINNMNTPPPSSTAAALSLPYAVIPTSFSHDPKSLNDVPLHFANYEGFGSCNSTTVTGIAAGLNLNQSAAALLVERIGLFHGQGGLQVSEDQFQGNLFHSFENGNENSKELSSPPNVNINPYSDHCCICRQKKRNVVKDNLTFNGVTNMDAAEIPSSITSSDFGQFNLVGSSQNNKRITTLVFEQNAGFQGGISYANGNVDQDVVAAHRKGSSSRGGNGSVFVEYEFIPASGKGGRRVSHESGNEFLMTIMKKNAGMYGGGGGSESQSVMMGGGGDTSCVTTTTTCGGSGGACGGGGVDASSSIDLSLRLSY